MFQFIHETYNRDGYLSVNNYSKKNKIQIQDHIHSIDIYSHHIDILPQIYMNKIHIS